jgi:hypothetical protein
MQKVAGERYVYKFVCSPEALFSMTYSSPPPSESHQRSTEKNVYFNQTYPASQ